MTIIAICLVAHEGYQVSHLASGLPAGNDRQAAKEPSSGPEDRHTFPGLGDLVSMSSCSYSEYFN